MKFFFFEPPAARHLRKSRERLADAKLKRVEHQAAAERHRAMTGLYAQRIGRIESEISQALQAHRCRPDFNGALGPHPLAQLHQRLLGRQQRRLQPGQAQRHMVMLRSSAGLTEPLVA